MIDILLIPAQAKVGKGKIGYAQLFQDIAYCQDTYPNLVCRALATKFMPGGTIAMFELTISGDSVKIVQEKHYDLVPEGLISDHELEEYNSRAP